MAERPTQPEMSEEMRRFIEEEREAERLIAEAKRAPIAKSLQAKMDSQTGIGGADEPSPLEELLAEEGE